MDTPTPPHLPVTPAIRRLAMAYLSLSPFGLGQWFERHACDACKGEGRGFRNEAGEFHRTATTEAEANRDGFHWWACGECRGYGYRDTHVLPLHIPAALAIARLRLAELIPDADAVLDNEVVGFLLTLDPELAEVPRG